MHLDTTPDPPPAKPCIRDLHELLRDHLPPATVIKSLPLPELARRCHEIAAEHRRFREEVPLVLAGEERRRHRYSGALTVASSHAEVA